MSQTVLSILQNLIKGMARRPGCLNIHILFLISIRLSASSTAHQTGMAAETDNLMSRSPYVVASIVLIAVVPIVSWLLQCNQRPKTFPPGPPTIPVLGNIHQMPTKHIFLKFAVSKARQSLCHTLSQSA